MVLAEHADHVGERQGGVGDGGIENPPDGEGSPELPLQRGAVAFEAFEFAEDAQAFLVVELALAGEAEAAAAAVAQHDAEVALELAHVGADRGGGQSEFLLRGREPLVADDGREDLEELQIGQRAAHRTPPAGSKTGCELARTITSRFSEVIICIK